MQRLFQMRPRPSLDLVDVARALRGTRFGVTPHQTVGGTVWVTLARSRPAPDPEEIAEAWRLTSDVVFRRTLDNRHGFDVAPADWDYLERAEYDTPPQRGICEYSTYGCTWATLHCPSGWSYTLACPSAIGADCYVLHTRCLTSEWQPSPEAVLPRRPA